MLLAHSDATEEIIKMYNSDIDKGLTDRQVIEAQCTQ